MAQTFDVVGHRCASQASGSPKKIIQIEAIGPSQRNGCLHGESEANRNGRI
jgi:hypothetical protein